MKLSPELRAFFKILELTNRKIDLEHQFAEMEVRMHVRYGKDHGGYDPDYSSPSPTLREQYKDLKAEYDQVSKEIKDFLIETSQGSSVLV